MQHTAGNGRPAAGLLQIHEAMAALETFMHEAVNTDVAVLRDASRHILGAGGKRIRPRLTLLTYMALGGTRVEAVFPLATAVEFVHTASVVHDDINDHGLMRRGRPSVNSLWGRTFALLTGDFLFTKVYELMSPYGDFNILLAEATKALVEGETMQAVAVKEGNYSRAVYYDIIGRKTAALFRAGAQIGARMANVSPDIEDALGQFGFNIGLAFQIVDDLLDLTANDEQLGKTSGIDVEQGRGFAVAFNGDDDPLAALRAKANNADTIREGYEHARALVNLAIANLDGVPDGPARDALISLAHSTIERKY
jgi:geranylgeranyl pyrophosphate synthase